MDKSCDCINDIESYLITSIEENLLTWNVWLLNDKKAKGSAWGTGSNIMKFCSKMVSVNNLDTVLSLCTRIKQMDSANEVSFITGEMGIHR